MSRTQQPSILSFFQPSKQQQSKLAASSPSRAQQPPPQYPPRHVPVAPPPQPMQVPPPAAVSVATLAPLITLPPSTASPHPLARIVPMTEAHIPALRRINALLLCVNYTDSFYRAVLDPAQAGRFSRAIVFADPSNPSDPAKVVGGLVCRLKSSPFDDAAGIYSLDRDRARDWGAPCQASSSDAWALYIQSLVLLAPYRRLGLAAAAIEGVLDDLATVAADARGHGLNIEWVYAHVWTENEDALGWYDRRGFQMDARIDDYYFKLKPGSAWVVKRRVPAHRRAGHRPPARSVEPCAMPASVTAAAVNLPSFPTPTEAASTEAASTTAQPSENGTAQRPGPPSSALSFQNKRPDMEWNDLPQDMVTSTRSSSRCNRLSLPAVSDTTLGSSNLAGRKKKDRKYAAAAFET